VARVVLADAKAVRAAARGRAKTDKVDARLLARLLAAGFLAEVWTPDEQTRSRRRLVSRRAQLVRQRTREKNQVHAVLMRRLLGKPPMSDAFGVRGRAWLARLELPADERLTVDGCLRHIDMLNEEIRLVERAIAADALTSPEMRRLLTIPGVNAVTACALIGAIDDIRRFPTPAHLVGYLGLDPRVIQSGSEPARHGRTLEAGAGRGPARARRGGLVPGADDRPDACLPPADPRSPRRQRRNRRGRAQARGDLLAHAHPRGGLRLRASLADPREAAPARAAHRCRAPPRSRSSRARLRPTPPARARARARCPGRDRLQAADCRLDRAQPENERGCRSGTRIFESARGDKPARHANDEMWREFDAFAYALVLVANRLCLDAEEAGLAAIDFALAWLTLRLRYGLADLPGSTEVNSKRAESLASPRRGDIVFIRGLTTSRRWLRQPRNVEAQREVQLDLLNPRFLPALPSLSMQERLAIHALARAASEPDLLARVHALFEAIEFYASGTSTDELFTGAERKAILDALPAELSDKQRARVADLLPHLNNAPVRIRLMKALDVDRVPLVRHADIELLWALRKLRNDVTHGRSSELPAVHDVEHATSIVARMLVFRVERRREEGRASTIGA
jgi:hypothetical protein